MKSRTINHAERATTRAMSPEVKIVFHFESNSSCPWYIIIYQAHIVIKNTAATQKRSIKALSTRARRLSTFQLDHPDMRPVHIGEKVDTGTVKLVLVISVEAFAWYVILSVFQRNEIDATRMLSIKKVRNMKRYIKA